MVIYNTIVNGQAFTYLNNYILQLTPGQKIEFSSDLETFFINSPLFMALLEPIEVDFFISELKNLGSGTHAEYIKAQEHYFTSEIWPVSRLAMNLIANCINR